MTVSGPIKVLYINNAPFVGGAQITLRNIVARLNRSLFEPIIAIPEDADDDVADFFGNENADLWRVPMPRLSKRGISAVVGMTRGVAILRQRVLAKGVRIIHTNAQRGGVVGLALQATTPAQLIWTVNDLKLFGPVRFLTRFAARVTAVSAAVQHELPRKDVILIYNGVDVVRAVTPAAVRKKTRDELRIPKHAFVVGNVGRIEYWKGTLEVARVMEEILEHDPVVWFVQVGGIAPGSESYAASCRDTLSRFGARAAWLGFQTDVARLYVSMDLFVHLPVLNRYGHSEAFGMSVAEAMGYELPVVVTAVGGVPEVVEDGVTGFVCEPGDHAGAAQAVRVLRESPERRSTMGMNGRERQARLFDQDREVRDFERLYLQLVARSHSIPETL